MEIDSLTKYQLLSCCKKVSKIWYSKIHQKNGKRRSVLLSQQNIIKEKNSIRKHTCNSKCFPKPVKFKVYKKINPLHLHLCIEEVCFLYDKDIERHKKIIHEENHLFVCKKNGNYHLCGIMCQNIEHSRCTVTKRELEEPTSLYTESNKTYFREQAIKLWKETFLKSNLSFDFHECNFEYIPGEEGYKRDESKYGIQKVIEDKVKFIGPSNTYYLEGVKDDINNSNKQLALVPRKKTKFITPGCEIIHVPVMIYSSEDGAVHMCFKNVCKMDHSRMKQKMSMTNIYVCKTTGKPHYCGEDCDKTIENKEGVMVCQYTGICQNYIVQKSNNFSNTSEHDTVTQGFLQQNQNQQGKAEKYTISSAYYLNSNQLISLEQDTGSFKNERKVKK